LWCTYIHYICKKKVFFIKKSKLNIDVIILCMPAKFAAIFYLLKVSIRFIEYWVVNILPVKLY